MTTTQRYIQNILRVANSASESSIQEGLQWYSEAADIAISLGRGLKAGAGVLAALSPNKSWPETVRLAKRGAECGVFSGSFASAIRKANTIWDMDLDPSLVLVGKKEQAFYHAIVNRGRTFVVCVDRHAASVAKGRPLNSKEARINKREYDMIAHCYRVAARSLFWWPAELQAIVWVEWRKR